VSKIEQKEIKLEVILPPVGFPRSMYFNRFHIEREDGFRLVQFGMVCAFGLLDSYSCVFSGDGLRQNEESLLAYLNRIGRPAESSPPMWKGVAVEKRVEVVDVVAMAFGGESVETCLFFYSQCAAARLIKPGTVTDAITAQPLVLLRSSADLQRQLIIGLYEE
jgi:hypothetical protein